MSLSQYLHPGRRFLAVALSLTVLGMSGPVWAHPHDDDEASDAKAKKEVRAVTKPSGPREERVVDPYEEHRRYIASLERGRERKRA